MHVHSNVIHHSQKVETTRIPISGWMNKQIMVYIIHTMEYYSAIKRNEVLIHTTMCPYEPQKHYAKGNEPETKR